MTRTAAQIIADYWTGGLPRSGPEAIVESSTAAGQIALHPADIRRAKILRFELAGGLWSSIHVYWPVTLESRRALIYVSGHESDWAGNWVTIGEALSRGIVCAEMFMVGYKSEAAPYLQSFPHDFALSGGGTVTIADHDDFADVAAAGDPTLPIFLDPVFRVAKWLRDNLELQSLGIAGHSGGGWTALMAGALDSTIDFAASIHGWCPIGATGEPARDYEQTGPWVADTNYDDYAKMMGSRRNIVITGTEDPVFGESVLGQAQIDGWTADIKAAGCNFDQYTIVAEDHVTTAAEAVKVCDEFDAIGPAYYLCPVYSSTLANAQQMAACLNTLAGYPSRGSGGVLVPVATWDGSGATPAGWTTTYAAVDAGGGNGTLAMSAQDYDRLFGSLAALDAGDQVFVAAERGNITGV